MALLVRRRRALRRLLLAWCAYWLALVLGVLGRPALLTWRLTHDAASHGGVAVNLTNDVLSLAVTAGGATRWAEKASILTLALWVVVPPLLLYIVWLRGRSARRTPARPAAAEVRAGAELDRDGAVLGAREVRAGGGSPGGRG